MFDFLDNFFDTTVKTVRNGLILMVIALAVYFGVKQKSIVAFGTTALAGSIAIWIASDSGLGIFPRLFGEAIEGTACAVGDGGGPLGLIYYSGTSGFYTVAKPDKKWPDGNPGKTAVAAAGGRSAQPRPGSDHWKRPYWRCLVTTGEG